MYGKHSRFEIVENNIAVDLFKFSISNRTFIRKKYNLENKIVFGHTGRFDKRKKPYLLIRYFTNRFE